MFGSRIQILGSPHAGKSLLTYLMMGSANKTCRHCVTPIIQFINDWTGETETTCFCGKNDPMKVVLFDTENCFDPSWASTWGVRADLDFQQELEDKTQNIVVTDDAALTVIRTSTAEQVQRLAETIIRDGSADMIAIDSLAALQPGSRRAGKSMIGDQSKAVTHLTIAIIAAQGEAMSRDGLAPTIIMPNQERVKIGGFASHGTPMQAAGGEALKFNNTVTWKLRTKYNGSITNGHKISNRFGDVTVVSKKDKESGGTGSEANYRVYVGEHSIRNLEYGPGDTDESGRIFKIIKELGAIDERWYHKKGAKIIVLGREFTTAQAVNEFLMRPDIVYMLRYPLYALKFPEHLRRHLDCDRFAYTPFKDDPILELYEEADLETGRNVQSRERDYQPVMLDRKKSAKKADKEPAGDPAPETDGNTEQE